MFFVMTMNITIGWFRAGGVMSRWDFVHMYRSYLSAVRRPSGWRATSLLCSWLVFQEEVSKNIMWQDGLLYEPPRKTCLLIVIIIIYKIYIAPYTLFIVITITSRGQSSIIVHPKMRNYILL